MKKSLIGLSIVSSILLLTACGGSDSDGVSTITGQFIDGVVEGADYNCSSGSTGTTNSNGEYTCKVGDTVIFSVAGVELGSAIAEKIITPKTLQSSEEAAINIAQVLQTLDDDGDTSNGIQLNKNSNKYQNLKQEAIQNTINWSHSNFDTVVGGYIGEALVNETTAKEHMENTIASFMNNNSDSSDTTNTSTSEYDGKQVLIYNNISTIIANQLKTGLEANSGFEVLEVSKGTTCTDLGFSGETTTNESMGVEVVTYISESKMCSDVDYSGVAGGSGSSTVAFAYDMTSGNTNNGYTSDTSSTSTGSSYTYQGKYVYIYKNINSTIANSMASSVNSYAGFATFSPSSSTSCTDYGFTGTPTSETDFNGISSKTYIDYTNSSACTEADYSGAGYTSGSSNVGWYYNYQ